MDLICDNCGFRIDRNLYDDGACIEEYQNKYGTLCPNCYSLVKPSIKPKFVRNAKIEVMKLQAQFLEKLRDRLRGK